MPGVLAEFVITLQILRRRFAHAASHARIGYGRDRLLDLVHLDLVKPIVAEIEPVTEHAFDAQPQRVQGRGPSVTEIGGTVLVRDRVLRPVRVEWPPAE